MKLHPKPELTQRATTAASANAAIPEVMAHEREFTDHLTVAERSTLLRLLTQLADK